MDKHLMASVYEMRGDKEKARIIYRNILQKNPSDKSAESALRRISQRRISAKNINENMLTYFKKSNTKDELYELERWLLGN
ncbi:hypothetical protein [Helicobacter sp. 23-1045]